MKFDFAKTLSLVKGGLIDHQATWKEYLETNPDWQQTATVLTGPLIVANVVLSVIFTRITGGFAYFGYYSNFFAALFWGLILAGAGIIIAVFTFSTLAGMFKGKSNFSRAFAAVSLAAIPAWVAGVVGALVPGYGFLIILAGGITSLVFMYKIMPLALEVPAGKRLVHFIVSLVIIVVVNMIVGGIIGTNSIGSGLARGGFGNQVSTSGALTGAGVLGEFERQGRLMAAAKEDSYAPPGNSELSESQVVAYVKVLKKTRVIHAEYAEKVQNFSTNMEAKEKAGESPSAADLATMYRGIGGMMSANNAELEVVKTGGGNWAEHLWVKEQLRIAKIQLGDGSAAIAHNYQLYEKYKKDLG